MRSSPALASPLLFALSLGLAPGVQAATESSSRSSMPGLSSPQAQAQFHVLAGEMAAGRNLPETAAQEFLQALDYQPSATLAARATGYALAAKRDDLALAAARRWLSAEASSMDAREVIAVLSLKAGNVPEAQAQCEAIIKGHPGGEGDGYRHVALILAQEKSIAQPAVALMKTLVAEKPQFAGGYRALSLLAFRFDDLVTAEKAARDALKLAPNERESTLLLVAALVRKGALAEADNAMEGLLAEQKDPRELRLGYARLLIDAEQRPQAREQLLKVIKADPANGDAHFALGLLALDDRALDDAEKHFQALTDNSDRKNDAAYYLGRIAEMRKRPEEALGWYERVLGGNQTLDAYVRRARLLAELKRLPEARQLLGGLRDQYPPLASRLTATEGEILADQDAFTEALALYDAGLKANPDDEELLYARSLLHDRMGRFELAEADLRKLISKNDGDARSLNALGYLLVVHTNRLDEAAKLVNKAHDLTPNDPAILDSMGWLLFKQNKPREALPWLEKAMAAFPDPEVAAHLGDTLWALGEHEKAMSLLNAALAQDPDHKVLRETQQRLQKQR